MIYKIKETVFLNLTQTESQLLCMIQTSFVLHLPCEKEQCYLTGYALSNTVIFLDVYTIYSNHSRNLANLEIIS